MESIYNFKFRTLAGDDVDMERYRNKVLLLVNTASKCGFTPQYKGLEALHQKYRDKGFEVLGFPCDQFGHQEPGGSSQISEFCEMNFGVTFTLSEKVCVNGPNALPLFTFVKAQCPGILGSKPIKWNFTKFLVNRSGEPTQRFASATKPDSLEPHIESLL